MKRRVVITGLGVLTAIGIGKDDFWANLLRGKSGISEISGFDTSKYPCHLGGEIKNFAPEAYLRADQIARMGRGAQFAVIAADMAIKDAELDLENVDRERMGVFLGTTNGEAQVLQEIHEQKFLSGSEAEMSSLCPKYPAFQINASVAREFGISGDNLMIPNACAAGNFAIGYAFDLIRSHKLDFALTGGVDPFSRVAFTGFTRLLAVAKEKVQPFDRCRKGIMVGEGAGMLIIETLESALERKAHIYGEILGYGLSCDAFHITTPHPEAKGILLAMERALKNAGIAKDEVDYVSPHGTGTIANDKAEAHALKTFFGERYRNIPVSSVKSMLGHTMGAASAIEAVTCGLILEHGMIPPTINYEDPDPECEVDCVPNVARQKEIKIALNNSYAFGGNNSCLVMKKI